MGDMIEKQGLLEEEDLITDPRYLQRPSGSKRRSVWIHGLAITLLLSILGNIALSVQVDKLRAVSRSWQGCGSKWGIANLTRDMEKPIYASTQYGPRIGTQEERDALWQAIDISEGIIALPDEYARESGLPLSQRFAWDQSQGIYILGAFHQIHCLQEIQKYTSGAHRGQPADNYMHVEHCLDTLLQDVRCHADDLPWYELPPPEGGLRQKYAKYQSRQCKSWDGLMKFARQHNACYKYEGVLNENGTEVENQFEHYSYCSRDSPYFETMKKHFEKNGIERLGYDP